MIDDRTEREKFLKEVNKKTYVRKSSIDDEVFLTQESPRRESAQEMAHESFMEKSGAPGDQGSQQAISIDLQSAYMARDRSEDILTHQIIATGDFVQHNRLAIRLGKHKKIDRYQT